MNKSTRNGLYGGTAVLVLALLALASYANTFGVPFLLDDVRNVVENASLRSWHTAFDPPSTAGVGGRPLLNATFAANYAFGGLAVRAAARLAAEESQKEDNENPEGGGGFHGEEGRARPARRMARIASHFSTVLRTMKSAVATEAAIAAIMAPFSSVNHEAATPKAPTVKRERSFIIRRRPERAGCGWR